MKKYSVFLVLLFITIKSYACSCNEIKIKKSYKLADIVFIGEVISFEKVKLIHEYLYKGKKDIFESYKHNYVFKLKRLYKGKMKTMYVKLSTDPDEAACGYRFEKGKEYLVYSFKTNLEVNSDLVGVEKKVKPFFTTHLCTRTDELKFVKKKEFRKLARYERKYFRK